MSGHGNSLARDLRSTIDRAHLVDRTHGGDGAHWAESTGIETKEILDFSASINPLGPPTGARKAFIASSGAISCYPDAYGEQLKKALARRHGMDPAEILIGNGSTQLIYLLCAALRPRTALVVGPAFSEYSNALTLAGARIHALSLSADNGFRFSLQEFLAAWETDCDIAFLATPNSVMVK
jgi:threonine-phosphate decarboxylase